MEPKISIHKHFKDFLCLSPCSSVKRSLKIAMLMRYFSCVLEIEILGGMIIIITYCSSLQASLLLQISSMSYRKIIYIFI